MIHLYNLYIICTPFVRQFLKKSIYFIYIYIIYIVYLYNLYTLISRVPTYSVVAWLGMGYIQQNAYKCTNESKKVVKLIYSLRFSFVR